MAGPDPLGGDAVHLSAAGPYPPPRARLVGRSCHDQADLDRPDHRGLRDRVAGLPDRVQTRYGPPLGPAGLRRAGRASPPCRVLALGGVETPDAGRRLRAAGAAGVAVMGAVMRADDPARAWSRRCCAAARSPARAGADRAGRGWHDDRRTESVV